MRLMIVTIALLWLTACGQKGPLFLPESTAPESNVTYQVAPENKLADQIVIARYDGPEK